MIKCATCGSPLRPSRSRNRWEAWRKKISGKRPYRCHECGRRAWHVDMGPKFTELEREAAERAVMCPPPPPTVSAQRGTRQSDDLNLDSLDVLPPVGFGQSGSLEIE